MMNNPQRIRLLSAAILAILSVFVTFTASFQPTASRSSSRSTASCSFRARQTTTTILFGSEEKVSTTTTTASIENEAADQEESEDDDGSSSSPQSTIQKQRPDNNIQRQYCVTGVSPARDVGLNEAVSLVANTSLEKANNLIDMGAVWARMESLTEEDVLAQYDSDVDLEYSQDFPKGWGHEEENLEEDNNLDEYIEKMQAQRYRRILKPTLLPAGTDLRIYPNPRRFPACYEISGNSLLYQDTTFIVVDKPPMLPTQPDASNYHENCPGCVQDILGPFYDIQGNSIARPLLCHRVDAVVGGCVVLSKDRNGQRVFQEFQRQRKLKKLYLAVTTQPVPLGMHLHWMWAPQSSRGSSNYGPPCQLVSHVPPESRRKARQFWTRCILEVVKCKPIDIIQGNEFYSPPPNNTQHYQTTIRLVTGRKHQVRAQLASLGAPIIGDTLYGPMSGLTLNDLETDEEVMDAAISKCKIPTSPIGLQAHAILFGGIKAQARPPWWAVSEDDSNEEKQ